MDACELLSAIGNGCLAALSRNAAWLLAALVAIAILAGGLGLRARQRRAPRRAQRGQALRRRLLAALALLPGGAWTASPSPQRPMPRSEGDVPGTALTTLRLRNLDRRQAVPAGQASPMFGQPFRQGDVAPGALPRFTLEDGTPCPATLWGMSYWPDGSLKFCSAMLLLPRAVGAGQMLTLQVWPDGQAGAPSRRRVEELRAAALCVELEGRDGLAGRWRSSLDDGIRDGRDVVRLADGPAGSIWRIGAEFRDMHGQAHGQLYCWHYIAALQDPGGALQGLRYLGRVAQPWTDVAQPPARHRDLSARLLSGDTEIRALQGHSDSETPGDTIRLPHYGSFFTAGVDATWDCLQPDGQPDTATPLQVRPDARYLQRSRLVPPYDLRADIRLATDAQYHPMGRGTVTRGMGTTGERTDIGVWPEWNVQHLITQDPSHERVARVNAMAAAGWRLNMRKRGTRQPVPCVANRARYAGLGPIEANWRGYSYASGMVKPGPNESLWKEDTAHRPGCVYWPYLFSGEPQYLDLLVEHAFAHVLDLNQGTNTYATTPPITSLYIDGWKGERNIRVGADGPVRLGAGVLFNGAGGLRIAAWSSRDVAQAAALSPHQPADGAATREYLHDVMDAAYAAFDDYATRMPRSFTQAGMFVLRNTNESPWMQAYFSWSLCHQADVLGTPAAARTRAYLARFWRSYAAVADIGGMTAYRANFWIGKRMVERVEDVVSLRQGRIAFSASTGRGTILDERKDPKLAWNPSDGDVFVFGAPEASPLLPSPVVQPGQRLYAVNCQGPSLQLSERPGGNPLAIPVDVEIASYMCRARNLGPAVLGGGHAYNYASNLRGALAYHQQCGDDVDAAKTAMDRIVDGQRTRFDNRAKYLIASR
ncbi:hypothetical protein [Pseudorhodoferax sp.]|uniref:RIFT barrel domain-containing protein n=1 Tax=Pseudorhodoferax sp. TaxID=1993553 RepID=UPI0039E48EA1